MNTSNTRGFTLIELLVVIAIIGLLSSVVLASLNTARSKGVDASVKADLSQSRAQAELYYDANGNSYANICSSSVTSVAGVKNIYASLNAARTALSSSTVSYNSTYSTTGTFSLITCHENGTAWAAESPLKAGVMFCVGSNGTSATTTGSTLGASDAACN